MCDLISVIIPVYNIKPYLDKCLESICDQTYRDFEVLLIDDGSTDGSYEKCQEYADKYPFIRSFQQQHGGVSAARNFGIQEAKGKYIAFVDGDDSIDKRYLEILERYMSSGKYGVVFCGCRTVEVARNTITKQTISHNFYTGDIRNDFYELYAGTGATRILIQSCGAKLFDREKIVKNHIRFDRNFINGEDTIFMLHYLSLCETYYATDETWYNYYRYERGSASDLYSEHRVDNEVEHLKFTYHWLKSNSIQRTQEIMSFDIAGYIGIMAEALLKLSVDLFSKYSLFKKTMKRMQAQVQIPHKATKKKTALSLWCIRNNIYFPVFAYQWLKFKRK